LIVLGSLFLPCVGSTTSAPNQPSADRRARIPRRRALLAVLITGTCCSDLAGRSSLTLPVGPPTVLIAAAGLQFAGVAVGFAERPIPGLSWKFGLTLR